METGLYILVDDLSFCCDTSLLWSLLILLLVLD